MSLPSLIHSSRSQVGQVRMLATVSVRICTDMRTCTYVQWVKSTIGALFYINNIWTSFKTLYNSVVSRTSHQITYALQQQTRYASSAYIVTSKTRCSFLDDRNLPTISLCRFDSLLTNSNEVQVDRNTTCPKDVKDQSVYRLL